MLALFFLPLRSKDRTMKMIEKLPLRQLAVVSALTLLFAACKKDDTPQPAIHVAGLMAFNLAPDQAAVSFSLSGNNLGTSALAYNSYTGAYLPVYTGSREIRAFDNNSGNTLALATGNFVDSMYYSAFLIGANGHYRNVLVQDNFDSLAVIAGKAYVRYINAIADSAATPLVTLMATGGEPITANAAFGVVSAFKPVNAGELTVTVSNDSINASRVITLEENKVYTLLLAGLPGAADTTKTVQVKFITNGTLTP
jgi:hypothetical protein